MTQFEEIYRTYFDDVYRYIYRLSGDKNIAEEITSDTFFQAMRTLDGFRGECELRVWLCQIAKNHYYTYLKKARRTKSLDDMDSPEPPSCEKSLEERFIDNDQAAQIRMALHDLPAPYKEVFMWRVFATLRFREIGQIYSKSENWACVTYHRAKAMIQSRLEDQTYEK